MKKVFICLQFSLIAGILLVLFSPQADALTCTNNCYNCSGTSSNCTACNGTNYLYNYTCSATCPSGYYGNTANNLCSACGFQCSACFNSTQCTSCSNSYFLYKGTCMGTCPPHSSDIYNDGTCYDCAPTCSGCSGSISYCTACYNGQFALGGACYTQCPNGYYGSTLMGICVACNTGCATCNLTSCFSCSGSYYYNNYACATTCPGPLYGYNNNCSYPTCPVGTYPNNSTHICSACSNTCYTCFNSSTNGCTSCSSNRYYYNGACDTSCPSGYYALNGTSSINNICQNCDPSCLTCSFGGNNNCTSCSTGSYLSSGSCLTCSSNCTSCAYSANNCTSCAAGNILFNGVCYANCPNGYYLNGASCSSCSSNCSTCAYSASNCTACSGTNILFNNVCYGNCPNGFFLNTTHLNCQTCSSNCSTCAYAANNCTGCSGSGILFNNICYGNCPNGYYLNGGSCSLCSTNCSTCSYASNNCTSCTGANILFNNTCYANCPNGYYLNAGSCLACSNNCSTCAYAASNCTACSGTNILYNNVCYGNCPNGFFLNTTTLNCQGCSSNCSTCAYSASNCTKCTGTNILYNNVCYANCPNGYYLSGGSCLACSSNCSTCAYTASNCTACSSPNILFNNVCYGNCPNGYYLNGASCSACSSNCSTCAYVSSNCTKCSGTNILFNNVCYANCPNGYYLNGGSCLACSSNCSTCSYTSTNCTHCSGTNILFNNTCYANCPNGYYLNGGSCSLCSTNCSTCAYNSNNCTACSNGNILYDNVCYANCPNGLYLNFTSLNCDSCNNNCSTCAYTSTNCTRCTSGSYLYNSECLGVCPDGYYSDLTTNTCLQCSVNCSTCSGNPNNCTSCSGLTYLYNNNCVDNCPGGYFANSMDNKCDLCDANCITCDYNSTFCTSCSPIGQVLINNICYFCNDSCYTCNGTSANNCLSCINNTYLYENQCVNPCPPGFYEHDNPNFCSPCNSSCLTCDQTDEYICLSCHTGTYLFNSTCIDVCPDGTFENNATNTCDSCNPACITCYNSTQNNCYTCSNGSYQLDGSCYAECPSGYYGFFTNCYPYYPSFQNSSFYLYSDISINRYPNSGQNYYVYPVFFIFSYDSIDEHLLVDTYLCTIENGCSAYGYHDLGIKNSVNYISPARTSQNQISFAIYYKDIYNSSILEMDYYNYDIMNDDFTYFQNIEQLLIVYQIEASFNYWFTYSKKNGITYTIFVNKQKKQLEVMPCDLSTFCYFNQSIIIPPPESCNFIDVGYQIVDNVVYNNFYICGLDKYLFMYYLYKNGSYSMYNMTLSNSILNIKITNPYDNVYYIYTFDKSSYKNQIENNINYICTFTNEFSCIDMGKIYQTDIPLESSAIITSITVNNNLMIISYEIYANPIDYKNIIYIQVIIDLATGNLQYNSISSSYSPYQISNYYTLTYSGIINQTYTTTFQYSLLNFTYYNNEDPCTYDIPNNCGRCNNSCLTCNYGDVTRCTSCFPGEFLLGNECVYSCPSGYYEDSTNRTCLQCISPCQTCNITNGNSCQSCINGTYLYKDSCSNTCPSGQYGNNYTNTCDVCDTNCTTCFGPGSNDCIICSNGYYLLDQTCYQNCPNGYYAFFTNCYPYYYSMNNVTYNLTTDLQLGLYGSSGEYFYIYPLFLIFSKDIITGIEYLNSFICTTEKGCVNYGTLQLYQSNRPRDIISPIRISQNEIAIAHLQLDNLNSSLLLTSYYIYNIAGNYVYEFYSFERMFKYSIPSNTQWFGYSVKNDITYTVIQDSITGNLEVFPCNFMGNCNQNETFSIEFPDPNCNSPVNGFNFENNVLYSILQCQNQDYYLSMFYIYPNNSYVSYNMSLSVSVFNVIINNPSPDIFDIYIFNSGLIGTNKYNELNMICSFTGSFNCVNLNKTYDLSVNDYPINAGVIEINNNFLIESYQLYDDSFNNIYLQKIINLVNQDYQYKTVYASYNQFTISNYYTISFSAVNYYNSSGSFENSFVNFTYFENQDPCTYDIFNNCGRCNDSCLTCNYGDIRGCTSCIPGTYLFGNECLYSCPVDYYENVIERICSNCSYPCKTCDTTNGTMCTSCSNGYYLAWYECLPINNKFDSQSIVITSDIVYEAFIQYPIMTLVTFNGTFYEVNNYACKINPFDCYVYDNNPLLFSAVTESYFDTIMTSSNEMFLMVDQGHRNLLLYSYNIIQKSYGFYSTFRLPKGISETPIMSYDVFDRDLYVMFYDSLNIYVINCTLSSTCNYGDPSMITINYYNYTITSISASDNFISLYACSSRCSFVYIILYQDGTYTYLYEEVLYDGPYYSIEINADVFNAGYYDVLLNTQRGTIVLYTCSQNVDPSCYLLYSSKGINIVYNNDGLSFININPKFLSNNLMLLQNVMTYSEYQSTDVNYISGLEFKTSTEVYTNFTENYASTPSFMEQKYSISGMISSDNNSLIMTYYSNLGPCVNQTNVYCDICNTNCLTCDGPTCTSCYYGYSLFNGECLSACPQGYISVNSICELCIVPHCYQCQDNTTFCSVCESQYPYFINNFGCVKDCPDGYGLNTINSTCNPCFNNTCQRCEFNATDNNRESCIYCNQGYYYLNGQCLSQCPIGTYISTENNSCIYCDQSCLTCTNYSTICTSCNSGQIYDSVNNKCISQCPSGYYEDYFSYSCIPCSSLDYDCLTCNSFDNCTSCVSPMLVFNYTNCVSECPSGYGYDGISSCAKCRKTRCISCPNSLNTCSQCKSGYYLNGNSCVANCPSGTFPNQLTGTCDICDVSCETCTDSTTCLTCNSTGSYPTYDTISKLCVSECPIGTAPNYGMCESCDLGCDNCTFSPYYECYDQYKEPVAQIYATMYTEVNPPLLEIEYVRNKQKIDVYNFTLDRQSVVANGNYSIMWPYTNQFMLALTTPQLGNLTNFNFFPTQSNNMTVDAQNYINQGIPYTATAYGGSSNILFSYECIRFVNKKSGLNAGIYFYNSYGVNYMVSFVGSGNYGNNYYNTDA